MVPMFLPEHVHHDRAVGAINRRLDAGDTMVIVAHTLLETYSTVTRLPVPSRVRPSDALAAIERSFLAQGIVVALRHEQYIFLLYDLVNRGTVGGQVYDAAIVACARQAGVTELLTLNERHFRRFEGDGLSVVVP